MAEIEKIRKSIAKAVKAFTSVQGENGGWSAKEMQYREPHELQKDLIVTSQNIRSLIFAENPKSARAICRGIHFCADLELDPKDSFVLWAEQLRTLNLSNTKLYEKKKEKIINFLCESQKSGYWHNFPRTFNLTNKFVIESLVGLNCHDTLTKSRKWFKEHKAKDNLGWGKDDEAEKSETTFTSNVIVSSILTGADPLEEYLQTAKQFLEKQQNKDGSWNSSSLTIAEPTPYAASIATLSLMLLSDNPFNERVEKGIQFLLDSQTAAGGWPLTPKEKTEFYVTYYAIHTLAFYAHLKENWENEKIESLRKYLKPQQISSFTYQNFLTEYPKQKFKDLIHQDVLCSKAIGVTAGAIKRRLDILKILGEQGKLEIAEIIDALKKDSKYEFLNKKAHMTQIKSDIEYLREVNLVHRIDNKYFVVFDFIKD